MKRNNDGELLIGGVSAVELADQYGTPLHVVDEEALRRRAREFIQKFYQFCAPVEVFYSYKTNCVPGILTVLHSEKVGAELISPFELWLAQRLKVPSESIVVNGVEKTTEMVESAIKGGCRLFNIDALDEIPVLNRICRELNTSISVGLRICPPFGWAAQFGLDIKGDFWTAVEQLSESADLDFCGLQAHMGTGLDSPKAYEDLVKIMAGLAYSLKDRFNTEIRYIDLGGGMGVEGVKPLNLAQMGYYRLFNRMPPLVLKKRSFSLKDYAQAIGMAIERNFMRKGLIRPTLILEPGRVLTSQAQVMLVRINVIKERTDGNRYALTDGGAMGAAVPLSFEYHDIVLANRRGAPPRLRYHMTGPICSPGDVLEKGKKMPRLEEGDLLAVLNTGAYFTSCSNNFAFPRPAIVMVGSDGQSRIIRRRENFEDLINQDML